MANITLEDVRTAVADLEANGVSPSVAKIRAQLGRGSISTITTHWRTIREEASNAVDPLPAELDIHAPPQALMDLLTAGAVRAAQEAYRRLSQDINDKIQAARAQLAADRAEAQEAFDQVMADAGEARERAEAAEQKLQEASVQLAVSEEAAKAALAERESMERGIADLRRLLGASDREKTTAEATLAAERQAHAQALNVMQEKIAAMEAERATAKDEAGRAATSAASLQEHVGQLRAEVSGLRTQLDAAENARGRLQMERDTARSEAAELRGRLAAKKPTAKAPAKASNPKRKSS